MKPWVTLKAWALQDKGPIRGRPWAPPRRPGPLHVPGEPVHTCMFNLRPNMNYDSCFWIPTIGEENPRATHV